LRQRRNLFTRDYTESRKHDCKNH